MIFESVKKFVGNPNNTIYLGFSKSKNNPEHIHYFVQIISGKMKDSDRHYITTQEYKILEKIHIETLKLRDKIKAKEKKERAEKAKKIKDAAEAEEDALDLEDEDIAEIVDEKV